MVGLVPRDLECFLCQQHFEAVHGDFIIPEEIICDTCRAELALLTEDELRQTLSARLVQRGITNSECIERVIQTLRHQRIAFAF